MKAAIDAIFFFSPHKTGSGNQAQADNFQMVVIIHGEVKEGSL